MTRVGCKELLELIEDWEYARMEMPAGVTAFALAKACYRFWSDQEGEALHRPEHTLYLAIADMITFIRTVFTGGEEWANEATIAAQPWSEGYYIHQIMSRRDKFGAATRLYWDFVLRGEDKLRRKRKAMAGFDQLTLIGEEDEETLLGQRLRGGGAAR